jgi:hypothetical protein
MRQTNQILAGTLLGFLAAGSLVPLAFAQSYGYTSPMTLEQELQLARERIKAVQDHPGDGSGTPYLNANGVIGASIISGAIFGSIFVAFIARARQIEKKLLQKKLLQ